MHKALYGFYALGIVVVTKIALEIRPIVSAQDLIACAASRAA